MSFEELEKMPLVQMRDSVGGAQENILRPKVLKDYIGQQSVKSKLEVFMMAATARTRHWITCCFRALRVWEKLR